LSACSYGTALNKLTNASEEKQRGDQALKNRDYQGHLYWYKKAAESGDVAAQIAVGDLYYANRNNPNGIGGDQGAQVSLRADYYEAEEWYQRAVDQGSAEAMVKLANMYLAGEVTGEFKQDAIALYKQAIKLGNREALIALARLEPVIVKARKYDEAVPGALICSGQGPLLKVAQERLRNPSQSEGKVVPKNQIFSEVDLHDKYPGCEFVPFGVEMVLKGDLEKGTVTAHLRNGKELTGITLPEMLDLK